MEGSQGVGDEVAESMEATAVDPVEGLWCWLGRTAFPSHAYSLLP